jgi:hypothetical protein
VKPATVPEIGSIKETTVRTRVVPADAGSDGKPGDFWEYLKSLSDQEWPRHMLYLYRTEPKPSIPLVKCAEKYFSFPSGMRVAVADEQEIEFALSREYGGGVFRIICKRGPEWARQVNIEINAPPRAITIPIEQAQPANGANAPNIGSTATGTDPTAVVASRAFDALGNQERTAADIGFGAMRMGLDAVSKAVEMQRNGSGGPGDELQRAFMQAMIARMTVDPMQQMLQFFTLMKELNGIGGGGGSGLADQLMKAAIERFLNPPATGAPVSLTAEIARMAPQLGGTVVDGLREYRLAMEAQRDALIAQRGGAMMPRPPGQPSPQVIPPAMPNPAPVAAPVDNGAPTMEFIEKRIVQILSAPVSAEQAADETIGFLAGIDSRIVFELAALGETGLLTMFQNRPILKPMTNNTPRLVEFIRAFLRMHAENVKQSAAVEANQKPEALPN